MAQDKAKPKIGAGHASAMFRQGLAELRQAAYPDSNVTAPPQYGLYGTRTPGEVMQDRKAEGRDPDEQPHEPGPEHEKDPRQGNEPDRGGHEPEPPDLDRD